MRGDLCPYDHGTDPVVLEDVALSRVLSFGPHGAQAPGTVSVTAVPEPPQGPNGNPPPPHLPLTSLPTPHLRNHHSNMGMFLHLVNLVIISYNLMSCKNNIF